LKERRNVNRKLALLSIGVATIIILIVLLTISPDTSTLASLACSGTNGVVDKTPSEAFTVEITFKNEGKGSGTWTVNTAFEGESWTWKGTSKTLDLKPSQKKTLTWNGNVPENATVNTVARLIVYYNDTFVPLGWWIHVVSEAELTITSSTVK
jgi:hypothetical protein